MLNFVPQHRRQWVFSAVAAAAVLAAGCSSSGSSSSGGGGKTITVGGVFPRTGPFASNALGVYETADAFFKNINDTGGVNGYKFKFIGIDDHGDTAAAVSAYQKLIKQDKVDVLMNENETTFLGASNVIKSSGIPVVGCFATPACYQTPGMFPVAPYVGTANAVAEVKYFTAHKIDKVDVLTINIPGAVLSAKVEEQKLKAAGIKVALSTTFDPTAVDFTALVARAKASGAKYVIFHANASTQLVPFVKSELQQGYKGVVFNAGYSPDLPSQLGAEADGLVVQSPSHPVLGAGKAGDDAAAVVKKYYPSIDLLNSYYAANAWTTGEVIVQAVKNLGGDKASAGSLTKALNGIKNWSGTFSAPLTYTDGANGDPSRCVQDIILQDGKWAALDGERFTCWDASVSTAPPAS